MQPKRIHFIGIGGISMSGIANILYEEFLLFSLFCILPILISFPPYNMFIIKVNIVKVKFI